MKQIAIKTETLATNSNYPINLQIGVSTGVFANINITTPDNLNSYIEVKIILYSYVKNSDGVSSLQPFNSSIIRSIERQKTRINRDKSPASSENAKASMYLVLSFLFLKINGGMNSRAKTMFASSRAMRPFPSSNGWMCAIHA